MKKNLSDLIRFMIGLVISLVVGAVVFYKVDWYKTLMAFMNFKWIAIPQFILAYFLSTLARAMASRMLLEKQPTINQSFVSLVEGYLLNNLFPFRLGEVGRAYFLGRKSNISVFRVLSANFVERILDLIFVTSLLVSTFPFVFEMEWIRPVTFTTLAGMILVSIFLYIIVRFRERFQKISEAGLKRFPIAEKFILPKLHLAIDGLSVLGDFSKSANVFVWMAICWFFNIAGSFIVLKQFVPSAPPYWAIFIVGVVAFAGAIPSSPAALGVLEGAVVMALSILGIASSTALAFALVWHFLVIGIAFVLGLYAFSKETESVWKIYEQLLTQRKSD